MFPSHVIGSPCCSFQTAFIAGLLHSQKYSFIVPFYQDGRIASNQGLVPAPPHLHVEFGRLAGNISPVFDMRSAQTSLGPRALLSKPFSMASFCEAFLRPLHGWASICLGGYMVCY